MNQFAGKNNYYFSFGFAYFTGKAFASLSAS